MSAKENNIGEEINNNSSNHEPQIWNLVLCEKSIQKKTF